jgi:hypothetical protein
MESVLLDAAGHRRSPATMPGYADFDLKVPPDSSHSGSLADAAGMRVARRSRGVLVLVAA